MVVETSVAARDNRRGDESPSGSGGRCGGGPVCGNDGDGGGAGGGGGAGVGDIGDDSGGANAERSQ